MPDNHKRSEQMEIPEQTFTLEFPKTNDDVRRVFSRQPVASKARNICNDQPDGTRIAHDEASPVEQRIEDILSTLHANGSLRGLTDEESRTKDVLDAKQQLLSLIEEVIGEDEVEDIDLSRSAKSRWGVRARNRVRAEQRNRLKGVNHE